MWYSVEPFKHEISGKPFFIIIYLFYIVTFEVLGAFIYVFIYFTLWPKKYSEHLFACFLTANT